MSKLAYCCRKNCLNLILKLCFCSLLWKVKKKGKTLHETCILVQNKRNLWSQSPSFLFVFFLPWLWLEVMMVICFWAANEYSSNHLSGGSNGGNNRLCADVCRCAPERSGGRRLRLKEAIGSPGRRGGWNDVEDFSCRELSGEQSVIQQMCGGQEQIRDKQERFAGLLYFPKHDLTAIPEELEQ